MALLAPASLALVAFLLLALPVVPPALDRARAASHRGEDY